MGLDKKTLDKNKTGGVYYYPPRLSNGPRSKQKNYGIEANRDFGLWAPKSLLAKEIACVTEVTFAATFVAASVYVLVVHVFDVDGRVPFVEP